jgi:hypothetical protein
LIENLKVLPTPTLELTVIFPPKLVTNFFTVDKPIPWPFWPNLSVSSMVENNLNIFFCFFLGMPIPLSFTVIKLRSSCVVSNSTSIIVSSLSLYFRLLVIKLSKISSKAALLLVISKSFSGKLMVQSTLIFIISMTSSSKWLKEKVSTEVEDVLLFS